LSGPKNERKKKGVTGPNSRKGGEVRGEGSKTVRLEKKKKMKYKSL